MSERNPKETKDVDASIEAMSGLPECEISGRATTRTASSAHQSSTSPPATDADATTDISSVHTETALPESKTVSEIQKSVATLPPLPPPNQASQGAESSAPCEADADVDVTPPEGLNPKRAYPNRTSSQQPTLPDEATPKAEYGSDSNPSDKRFDETKLNRAVVSLLESDYFRPIHDNRFDDQIFRDMFPNVEFDKLEYEESPIKAGVLSVLSLVDVYF
ncbi:hypothetical protein K440DRAFT_663696 [Wilcoxina mikolae CBS 423.85]|nr:hypothetical protein K440DRAFT_663696 [Wilcoxina mikolae CBS 423.85]